MSKGSLYVIEFSTGIVKVGRSNDPARRLEEHKREAGRYGVNVLNAWTSPEHEGVAQSERMLVQYSRTQGKEAGGYEYFSGASFDNIVHYAQGIDHQESARQEKASRKVLDEELVRHGQNVRKILRDADLTPMEAARKSGVSYHALRPRLNGEHAFNVVHAYKLAPVVGLSIREFVKRMTA